MRSEFAQLNGPVHYLDFGGEGTPMVLVHGLGGSAVNWHSLGPMLSERGRVFAVDLAGFGRTPLEQRTARVQDNRVLLDAFIRNVVREPVVLVGNSMGGMISLLQAALSPDQVRGLVLLDPSVPRPYTIWQDPRVILLFSLYAIPGVGEWVVRSRAERVGPEQMVRELLALSAADVARIAHEAIDAHVELAKERQLTMPWSHDALLDAARSLLRLLFRHREFAERVQAIRSPTLIIQGDKDRLVPVDGIRALMKTRPDWELEVLSGIGHVPQLESPVETASRIFQWMDARLGPAQ